MFFTFSSAFCQDLEQIKKAKAIEFHGALSIQSVTYSISGAPARQPWNNYLVSASPTLSIYGIQLPFSFIYSNNERGFRQPFNQFGVSPQYKWIKIHAGYRSISFSHFGMAGQVIYGGGLELKPGKFRFSALYGRSQKAVAEDTTKNFQKNLNSVSFPAYKRMLSAIKLGYGSEKNFIDFYALKGKDELNSIPYKPIQTEVLPSENLVSGLNFKFSMFKDVIEYSGELAASVYVRDLTSPVIDLASVAGGSLLQSIITPSSSSQLYLASESELKYKGKYFSLGGKYRRIDPDYKSMGAYYFQTDMQQYTGSFSTRLFKNKLNFNSSMGVQMDNVAKKKMATTQRNVYSGTLNYQMTDRFGIDLNYSNFGTAQYAGTRNLSDTSKINQINSSWTLSPHYILINKNLTHSFFLVYGKQELNDKNRFTTMYSSLDMSFSNLIYSLMNLDKKINYNAGINYSNSNAGGGLIVLKGASIGLGKTLLNDKMNLDFNLNANLSQFNNVDNGNVINLSGSCSYMISKPHSLRMNSIWLFNQSANEQAGKSFNEFSLTIQYTYTF